MKVCEVALSEASLNTCAVQASLRLAGCGAIVTFEGITRSPDVVGDDVHLDYEAWPERALATMRTIVDEAGTRWPLEGAVAIHRTGRVGPAEPAVVVSVACAHRGEAFEAAAWIIDRIKAEAAIWKQERTVARTTWI